MAQLSTLSGVSLLPFLKQLHLSPTPSLNLELLTFPQFNHSKRKLTSADLLHLEEISSELRTAYSNPPSYRLFALLDGECVSLFSVDAGEELFHIGQCSAASIGGQSIFLSCDLPLLKRLFPPSLSEEVAALASSDPLLIAERALFNGLCCWILPQHEQSEALLTPLFHHFPNLKEEKDGQGQTLLHAAVVEGNLIAARALLKAGCNSTMTNLREETPLHLAASHGNPDLVTLFLELNSLEEKDSDGNTPLHLAIEHGHLESARLLLNAGAKIDCSNKNGDTPVDLALTSNQSELSLLLFQKSTSQPSSNSSSSSSPSDPEGATYLSFEAAYEEGDKEAQIFWLQRLAQIKIDKKELLIGAHLLNGALTLTENSSVRAQIFGQLERIERLFFEELFEKEAPLTRSSRLVYYREELRTIRAEFAERVSAGAPIEEAQRFLTLGYQSILISLIDEAIALTGESNLDGFSVMGLGSMARLEVAPYSDVEFAFLIKESSSERVDYLRRLSRLITLKMVNIGETKCEIIRFKRRVNGEDRPAVSLTSSGFSMDIGALCPNGKEGVYELIGTPSELAQLQTEEWLRANDAEIILVNAMTTVSPLYGEAALVVAYQQEIDKILNQERGGFFSRRKLRQVRALELLSGALSEFQPRLDQDKIDLRGFDVKKELYRLPQTVVSALALYSGIKSANTLDRVDELKERGLISEAGAVRLKEVFRLILKLRVQTHLFYKTERELLYYPREAIGEISEELLPISAELSREILDIYRTLVPLHERALAFLQNDERALASSALYDPSVGVYDDSQRRGFRYDAALSSAEGALALTPSSSSHANMGIVQLEVGGVKKAVTNFEESLLLLKKEHGDAPHPSVADALDNLGLAHRNLGDYVQAIACHKAALNMEKELYGDQPHPSIAATLNNLALAYEVSDDYQGAIETHEAALRMKREIYQDQPHPDLADSLNNLGATCRKKGDHQRAAQLYKESLAIKRRFYGTALHPDVAASLSNLGGVYCDLNEFNKSIKYYQQALEMQKKIYLDRPHSSIMTSLNGLGNLYDRLGNYELAIEYYESALKLGRELYGDAPHPDIADQLNNLGVSLKDRGRYQEAIENHQAALAMREKLHHDRPHSDLAASLANLGSVYTALGDIDQAIQFYERALKSLREVYKEEPHISIALVLNNLGVAYEASIQYEKAIESYEESLAIKRKIYQGRADSTIATTLNNLGSIYINLNRPSEAVKVCGESFEILRGLYGDGAHPATASTLNNLGSAFDLLYEDDQSVKCHSLALTMRRELHKGQPHVEVAESLNNLAITYYHMKHYQLAIDHFRSAYEIYSEKLGASHPQTQSVKPNLDKAVAALASAPSTSEGSRGLCLIS